MSHKLEELLFQWENLRDAGKPVSVDELCRDCPELREKLRAKVVALEKLNQVLNLDETRGTERTEQAASRDDPSAKREPIPGYRLETRLGKGGFGEVWKAVGPGKVEVALKFVPCGSAAELRALQAVKNIRHPNLLPILGIWNVNGSVAIALELAEQTLSTRLREAQSAGSSGIPRPELLRYMQDAAKGLDFLNGSRHDVGGPEPVAIQHRDVKPDNLLLVGGCVKVGDFGLARTLDSSIASHSGSMTPAYAAPEFFKGRTTRWSDQYSLAVTYCMLRGGKLPFTGSAAEIMAGHLHRTPDLGSSD